MSHERPILFRRFPQAVEHIPWVPLGTLPTPVQPLPDLSARLAPASLFIKRDDCSARRYGGNKVRALEFLLGQALAVGAERVITAGALASHHVLATALFAREVGLGAEAVLWERPSAPGGPEALRLLARLGVPVRRCAGPVGALLTLIGRWVALRARGQRAYLVPPGGASARGALGFVEAALELGEQIAAGAAPAPASLWIACGTGASTAGLLVGLPLAGIEARVRAVCVTPPIACSHSRLRHLVAGARRLLAQAGVPPAGVAALAPLELLRGYAAPGYGQPSQAASAAVALLAAAGIVGETTYTGRAFAALVNHAAAEAGVHLFWHTLPAASLPPVD